MKNNFYKILISGFILSLIFSFGKKELLFSVPLGWEKPVYDFSRNPLTEAKIELGRQLFYDPILSRDSSISCANCHLQYTAFTHVDHDLSHGIDNRIGTRNSPALMNLAWNKSFMWDGGVNHLDMQVLAPLSHPAEMDNDITQVIEKLKSSKKYTSLFKAAFNDNITGEHFLKAFSQFLLTLVSANSKYDQVKRKESGITFSLQEQNGYEVFKKNCSSCHQEPLFTNQEFMNNGIGVDTTLNDFGRMNITQQKRDSLKFRVPTLRNIEFSYPYMHDGRFRKLPEVIQHYTHGIQKSSTLAPELNNEIKITPREQVDLIAFLLTLTDKEFLFNPKYSFPRN